MHLGQAQYYEGFENIIYLGYDKNYGGILVCVAYYFSLKMIENCIYFHSVSWIILSYITKISCATIVHITVLDILQHQRRWEMFKWYKIYSYSFWHINLNV